jgi:hypothetical protein
MSELGRTIPRNKHQELFGGLIHLPHSQFTLDLVLAKANNAMSAT